MWLSYKEKKSLVGCKWVFRVNYKANDSLEGYKVKLVAKDYIDAVINKQFMASLKISKICMGKVCY